LFLTIQEVSAIVELEEPMKATRKTRVRKFSSLMSEPLLKALQEQARRNGQSMRFVLEAAVSHYLEVVGPSSNTVRPEIIAFADETIRDYDKLLKRLSKA
jgi:hypothetical protein